MIKINGCDMKNELWVDQRIWLKLKKKCLHFFN